MSTDFVIGICLCFIALPQGHFNYTIIFLVICMLNLFYKTVPRSNTYGNLTTDRQTSQLDHGRPNVYVGIAVLFSTVVIVSDEFIQNEFNI